MGPVLSDFADYDLVVEVPPELARKQDLQRVFLIFQRRLAEIRHMDSDPFDKNGRVHFKLHQQKYTDSSMRESQELLGLLREYKIFPRLDLSRLPLSFKV